MWLYNETVAQNTLKESRGGGIRGQRKVVSWGVVSSSLEWAVRRWRKRGFQMVQESGLEECLTVVGFGPGQVQGELLELVLPSPSLSFLLCKVGSVDHLPSVLKSQIQNKMLSYHCGVGS